MLYLHLKSDKDVNSVVFDLKSTEMTTLYHSIPILHMYRQEEILKQCYCCLKFKVMDTEKPINCL